MALGATSATQARDAATPHLAASSSRPQPLPNPGITDIVLRTSSGLCVKRSYCLWPAVLTPMLPIGDPTVPGIDPGPALITPGLWCFASSSRL